MRSTYVNAILRAGGLPLLGFPYSSNAESVVESLLAKVDGLLLTGGKDLHPLLFGEQPQKGIGLVFPERDDFEIALARRALELEIPVLGICRGMQVLNVAAGGTLHQDIANDASLISHAQTAARSREWHSVSFEPTSKLAEVFRETIGNRSLNVNSIHHQAVANVAGGWVVSAVAPDGIIEAIECPTREFAIGVQWHPEELERHSVLFSAFLAAAQSRRDRNLGEGSKL